MSKNHEDLLAWLERETDLGHQARNAAFLRQVAMVCGSPGVPLPQASGKTTGDGVAALVSAYRFLGNEEVSVDDLRAIRTRVVLQDLPRDRPFLAIHDVTLLDYSRHNSKRDRRPIGDHKGKGYEYVPCLAADPRDGSLLGVLHDTLVDAEGPDDRNAMNYDYEPLFAGLSKTERRRLRVNHRHQLAVHVHGLASLLVGYQVIHVADREFDDVFVLGQCRHENHDFVVRCNGNRNVQMPEAAWIPEEARTNRQGGHPPEEGWGCVNLKQLIPAVPLRPYRTLSIDGKGRGVLAGSAARTAQLSIGACRIRLYRQAKRNRQYFRPPEPVDVNLVVIREPNPPEGVEPIVWVLLTSLPIEAREDLAWIGRVYETRWSVEDYFRLLKSGYQIEKARFDDSKKTAKLLVVLSFAAMLIIGLKRQFGLPSKGPLDDASYVRVKEAMRSLDNPDLDLDLRLFALVIKTGGWLGRRRDPLGPTILMRGLLQMLAIIDILTQHRELIEEAIKHPEVLRRRFCV